MTENNPAQINAAPFDPELKAQWTEALRSGKYDQTSGVLRDDSARFCCLGVLADLAAPHLWSERADEGDEADAVCFRHDANETMLSGDVLASVHLSQINAMELAEMNDGGKSFAEIADWIEENL